MEKIKIPTSFNIELEFELANLVQRFFGWLIDLAVQILYLLTAAQLVVPNLHISNGHDLFAVEMLLYLPVLLYHLVCETTLNGQSIGKKLVGTRVISETGSRPSFYQYLIRWLIRPFEIIVFLLPALLSILLSRNSQRLGDLAAGTLVIVSRVKTDINDTIFLELEDSYQPRYVNVLRLSDRDMNIIKTILETSLKQKNYELAQRTSDKIRTALQITEYQHPVEFLETVLKDYNYLSNRN